MPVASVTVGIVQARRQPSILDRDDGLTREVRNQRDLLLSERPNLTAVDGNDPDQLGLARRSLF